MQVSFGETMILHVPNDIEICNSSVTSFGTANDSLPKLV